MTKRLITLSAALALLAAACGSQIDTVADVGTDAGATDTAGPTSAGTGTSDTAGTGTGAETDGDGPPAEVDLMDGWFGDMEVPCGPTPEGMTLTGGQDLGVTADAVELAIIADVEGPRPGVNKEALDGTNAFTDWCNSLGGVNGRQLKLTHLDSKILEFAPRAEEACSFAFATVGTAVVIDDVGAQTLVDCDMVSVPAYTVSDKFALSDRMVQSNPNPPDTYLVLSLRRVAEENPEAVKHAAILTAGLPSLQMQRDRQQAGAEALGWEFVYTAEHAITEQNWGAFVADMKAKGVEAVIHVAEPSETNNMLREMVKQGIDLQEMIFVFNPNYYDAEYLELAGDLAAGQILDMSYVPFEEAEENPAADEFVEILQEFGGFEPSLIAVQAFSSALLFADALQAIGDDVTREALLTQLETEDDWTAGGITGSQDPGANTRSPCAISLRINDTGTGYERAFPDEGFDCDPANVVAVPGDFSGASAGG